MPDYSQPQYSLSQEDIRDLTERLELALFAAITTVTGLPIMPTIQDAASDRRLSAIHAAVWRVRSRFETLQSQIDAWDS